MWAFHLVPVAWGTRREVVINLQPLQNLKKDPSLVAAARVARDLGAGLYLVGGCLRDLLLDLNPAEYDFAVAGDAVLLARMVSERLGVRFIPLDPGRQISRIVVPGSVGLQLDFAPVAGGYLEEDLRQRDFTINAIAVDWIACALRDASPALIDPLGGAEDLKNRRLRASSPAVFKEDPLRLLRAARIGAQRHLHLVSTTRQWMQEHAHLASLPAGERVKREIFALLCEGTSGSWVRLLSEVGILRVLWPEIIPLEDLAQGPPHRDPVWEHSLKVLEACEELFPKVNVLFPQHAGELESFLREEMEEGINRTSTLKFCALLHDAGKPAAYMERGGRPTFWGHEEKGLSILEEIGNRLKLSNRTLRMAARVVRHHLRPLHLSLPMTRPTRRAMYRFFRETAGEGGSVCLLALADEHSKNPETPFGDGRLTATVSGLLDYFRNFRGCIENAPFLSGRDLMAHFNLAPGPRLGEILEALCEAQGAGEVRDREDALAYVRRLCGERR